MDESEQLPKNWDQIRAKVLESLPKNYAMMADNWTHVTGGSETGATWHRSLDAFAGLGFVQKTIHSVQREDVDITVNLFGHRCSYPIAGAPMSGVIASICDDAFLEMALAAKQCGIVASIGYPTGPDVHSRMAATGAPIIRIIKPLRDVDKLKAALISAQEAGCIATGIDIDSVGGLKGGDHAIYDDLCTPLSIDTLKKLRDAVRIPFILKGVLSEVDALSAIKVGADAIVVSTHSGSAMDYTPSALEMLPEIVRVVDKKMKVLFDSGIRRGSDVIKAMALGADTVLIGRLVLWGLAIGKAPGLQWIVQLLGEEMRRIMLLLGIRKLSDLNAAHLVPLNDIGDRIMCASYAKDDVPE